MSTTQPLGAGVDRNIGRLIGGRYRIVGVIGSGGMGAVYRAVHTDLGRDVAVKLLRPELGSTPEAVRRFEREAEAASRLVHPNCVRVTDFGRAGDGTMFLVMEFLAGRPLAKVLLDTPRLDPARAVHLAAQILDAVAHAHLSGVVHRDLKPENVMVVTLDDDPDGVKLLDFGIARLVTGERPGADGSITEPQAAFGTPEYLSPEQALGEPADGRADLYAVGVMLYEMLAGRRPFAGASRGELVAAHLTREPAPLNAAGAIVSPELEAIVARALRKRRDERWQTAQEFRDALLAAPVGPGAALAGVAPVPEPVPFAPATMPLQAPGQAAPASFVSAPPASAAPSSAAPSSAAPASAAPSSAAPASAAPSSAAPSSAAPASAAPASAAPAPASWAPASAPARDPRRTWVVVGALALVAVIVIVIAVAAASGGSSSGAGGAAPGSVRHAARTAPEADLAGVREAMTRGDHAGARVAAERLARAHPDDARVFVLLGHVMFAQREPVRGLAAYREAGRLDRAAAAADPELLANLRATFGDREHGEAAFALAEKLGPPAAPMLRAFADATRDPRLRERARRAAEKAEKIEAPPP